MKRAGLFVFFIILLINNAGLCVGFKDSLSFVAIIKNEARYIREWIEFHKLVGVDRFYIYDNESNDNVKDVLKDYIEDGSVVYKYFPGRGKQIPAYWDAINRYKDTTKYMGFIDLDEFVIPCENRNLYETIDQIISKDNNAAGVVINWMMYGSSNNMLAKTGGLVIENYKRRAPHNFFINGFVKTICDPRKISEHHLHYVKYKNNYYSVNENGDKVEGAFNANISCNKLRINHYFCKSFEEFIMKREKLYADHKDNAKRELEAFFIRDINTIYDNALDKYIPLLNNILKLKTNIFYKTSDVTISNVRRLIIAKKMETLKSVLPRWMYNYFIRNWTDILSAFSKKTKVLTVSEIRQMLIHNRSSELKSYIPLNTYNFLMNHATDILTIDKKYLSKKIKV